MININDSLLNFITNGVIIFIFSFILNFILFYFIKLGIFGASIKDKVFESFTNNSFLFLIIPFIVSFVIINYLSLNIILLDGDVKAIVETSQGEIEMSGELLKFIMTNFGAAAVFSTSARIAAGLVAKHGGQLAMLPKIGIIGGTSTGFTASYVLVSSQIPAPAKGITVSANLKMRYIMQLVDKNNAAQNAMNTEQGRSAFTKWLSDTGLSRINQQYDYTYSKTGNTHSVVVKCKDENKSAVLEELNRNNPDWFNQFINSPLEKGDIINSQFIQSLHDIIITNVVLHFVILYLLFNTFQV